jgi:hypothetical protein
MEEKTQTLTHEQQEKLAHLTNGIFYAHPQSIARKRRQVPASQRRVTYQGTKFWDLIR